jgi:spore coat protein A
MSRRLASPRKQWSRSTFIEPLERRELLAALLDPLSQPKFVNPLPNPLDAASIFQPAVPGGTHYQIGAFQFEQSLGLVDADGDPLATTVWGYGNPQQPPTYPGRTIVAHSDQPVTVHWTNELVNNSGDPLRHLLPVDTSIHWAETENYPLSGVPIVTHLHGGHSESASDGLPEAWFTPGFEQRGDDWVKEVYSYDNDQQAATLWYHDHALGITRLNVYAGLAGFYILRDDVDTGLPDDPATSVDENPLNVPVGPYEIPLVVQDRMFTEEGELYYPSEPEVEGVPAPSVLPEFFGDFVLVNGKTWPVLEVEPRPYRFRMLNGSDSRFYNMWVAGGSASSSPKIVQIGTDSGLLDQPVKLSKLTLGPGERADVVIDFSRYAGQNLILRNNGRSPFPKGETVDPRTTGQIMAFKVTKPLDTSVYPVEVLASTLRDEPIQPLDQTGPTRQLLLFEAIDEFGRLRPQLGTVEDGALLWADPTTETPLVDTTEVWEIYNSTEDAHPIHLHLVSFQVQSRQKFKADQDPVTGELSNIRLQGKEFAPPSNEAGWKDTVIMYPGQATRIIAHFDRAGEYVWHCHILSHEDHEMMRRYEVVELAAPAAAAEAEIPSMTVASTGDSDYLAKSQLIDRSMNVAVAVASDLSAPQADMKTAAGNVSATSDAYTLMSAQRRLALDFAFAAIRSGHDDHFLFDPGVSMLRRKRPVVAIEWT